MENIFLLPTIEYSKLWKTKSSKSREEGTLTMWGRENPDGKCGMNQYVYITMDRKPEQREWIMANGMPTTFGYDLRASYTRNQIESFRPIVITNDPNLVREGIQAASDDLLKHICRSHPKSHIEIEYQQTPSHVFYNNDVPFGTYQPVIPKVIVTDDSDSVKKKIEELQSDEHDYLPGFIKQYDSEEGELDEHQWTAKSYLKWLEINGFKIVKK